MLARTWVTAGPSRMVCPAASRRVTPGSKLTWPSWGSPPMVGNLAETVTKDKSLGRGTKSHLIPGVTETLELGRAADVGTGKAGNPATTRPESRTEIKVPNQSLTYNGSMSNTTTTGPRHMATAYHETLAEFRGELVSTAADFERMKDHHGEAVHKAREVEGVPAAVRDAYMAGLMAAHYGYTLAAILGVAEREFGAEVAERLAFVADEILTNGDERDRNADVMKEATAGAEGE